MFTCDICQKQVKDLKAHKARIHSGANLPASEVKPEPDAGEGQDLELDAPSDKGSNEKSYRCIDCGHAPLTYHQETCPACGAQLDWGEL